MASESPEQLRRPGWDVLGAVAIGGMIGASARRELAVLIGIERGHFPWATFWTNLSGSFVLGFIVVVALRRLQGYRYGLPLVATGILGAYTTMATYIVQSALLLKDHHLAIAIAYLLGSVTAGVACAYAGVSLARAITVERR